jgi:hypothetical protein
MGGHAKSAESVEDDPMRKSSPRQYPQPGLPRRVRPKCRGMKLGPSSTQKYYLAFQQADRHRSFGRTVCRRHVSHVVS